MIATFPVAAPEATGAHLSRLRTVLAFPSMLACMLIPLAVLTVRSRFDDPDMWWHLRLGQIIWMTHTIPRTDTLSYTTNHHAYIAHEWLSQFLIYGFYRIGGYSALMLWLCLFTAAILIAGYVLCALYSGNSKVAFLGALTVWIFATSGLAIRPHMVGYFLLVLELVVIHLGRTRNPLWLFGLPPLFAVWVNCHGSFFLGVIVMAIYLFSSRLNFQVGSLVAQRVDVQRRKLLLASALLSIAALFLNASGVQQILYPLNMMLRQPVVTSQVQEWLPLELVGARGIAFFAVLVTILLVVILRKSELFLHELLLLGASACVAVSHRRMIFAFGIVAAPILSRVLSTSWETYDARKDLPVVNAVFIAAALAVALWFFPSRQILAEQVYENSPVRAVDFIKSHMLTGPMLNDFGYGGYLIWAAPEHPVFVDGRADVFDWTGVLGEYGDWATLKTPPQALLDKYGVKFCLLAKSSPMVTVLPLLNDWTIVYLDENSVVLTRSNSRSLSAISSETRVPAFSLPPKARTD